MGQQLLEDFHGLLKQDGEEVTHGKLSLQAFSIARSLIVNPSTSTQAISSLLETLFSSLSLYPNHSLSLLSDIVDLRPQFSHLVFAKIQDFSLLPNNSPRAAARALSLLVFISNRDQDLISSVQEVTEGLFLSLCFRPCVSVRHWLLLNAERFRVRPSLLLTVLLGFTKDPYPSVRSVALDGLVNLCKCIVVKDRGMIEGCYCRAIELLLDMDECVRFSAVKAISEWGQVLVITCEDKSNWADVLFLQLCSMVRDMSVKVRVEAFNALGKVDLVSEEIMLQTLSKKVLPVMKEKCYPGKFSAKQLQIPASSAAGAFVHGLEDEFHDVD